MKVAGTFLFLFFATVVGTVGQEPKKPEPCADAQTQTDMTICWGNQYKAADRRLNEAYKQFAAKLDEAEKTQLKTAQLAWIKYRDANCEFVGDQYKGGTMRPMIEAICLTDVTDNRTKELKAQMKDRDQ